jgi:transketolase
MADGEGGPPEVLLIGTGSEVALCVAAYEQLKAEGIRARVVSMPSWELFEKQSAEYRDGVLPPTVAARVVVEAASGFGWAQYAGAGGAILCMETFGASAPLQQLLQKFGFTPENVVAAAKAQIARAFGAAQAVR